MNMEQLSKSLVSLTERYNDLLKEDVQCPNEPEFRAYHMLAGAPLQCSLMAWID